MDSIHSHYSIHEKAIVCKILSYQKVFFSFFYYSPRSFIVKMSSDFKAGGNIEALEPYVVDETELENKCWKYTWMGPVNDNTNQSTVCDNSPDFESIPCFEPIGMEIY